jgi:hypothetical protein
VLVGLALAAAAILALVDGPGVLGLAAANWAVELGWGIAAVLLLLNVFAPRRKKTVVEPGRGTRRDERLVPPATPAGRDHDGDRDGDGRPDDQRDHEGDGRTVGTPDRDGDGRRDAPAPVRNAEAQAHGDAGPDAGGRSEGATRAR